MVNHSADAPVTDRLLINSVSVVHILGFCARRDTQNGQVSRWAGERG